MHIAIITAGGAGMFCGSCMQDNTLARALIAQGAEVSLVPTYTPIRVDEENASNTPIFFGGINVYLDYYFPPWRWLPRWMTRWLDSPWMLKLATSRGVSNDATQLGGLTVAMLDGEVGPIRGLVREFVDFVVHKIRPDAVVFSNSLLVGALRELRRNFEGPIYCTLQGDDVFLDGVPEPPRGHVLELVSTRSAEFDGFLLHSDFYRRYMADYLSLDIDRMQVIPLGLDFTGHSGQPRAAASPPTIGYFARIAPEKGLLELAEAFLELQQRLPDCRLRFGGFLNPQHQGYFEEVMKRLASVREKVAYIGSPETHEDKVEFYRSIDVLCMPTKFQEPKGLYVLEALANGVPVVLPNRGAFPELIASTGGGVIADSNSPSDIADALHQILSDEPRRLSLAEAGHAKVRESHSASSTAAAMIRILQEALSRRVSPEPQLETSASAP